MKTILALRESNIPISKLLVTTLENSERAGKVPKVQKRTNTGPLFNKTTDKERQHCRLISITSAKKDTETLFSNLFISIRRRVR